MFKFNSKLTSKTFGTRLKAIRRFDKSVQECIEYAVNQALSYNLTPLYDLVDALPRSTKSKTIIAYVHGITSNAIDFEVQEVKESIKIDEAFIAEYPSWVGYKEATEEPKPLMTEEQFIAWITKRSTSDKVEPHVQQIARSMVAAYDEAKQRADADTRLEEFLEEDLKAA
jgi:hypothetical protein